MAVIHLQYLQAVNFLFSWMKQEEVHEKRI